MSLPDGDVRVLPGLLTARKRITSPKNPAHSAQQQPSQSRIFTQKARADSPICPKSFVR